MQLNSAVDKGSSVVNNVEFNVLGPVTVTDGSQELSIGGPKQRAVLAMLVSRMGQPLTADALAVAVYGDEAAAGRRRTIQTYVSTLRSIVGDCIVKRGPGWVLDVDERAIDATRFEELIEAARSLEPEAAARTLREGLNLWRGHAYADIEAFGHLDGEITRLSELRVTALQARIDADLESGRHSDLVGEIETLIAEHPYQERFRAQHMVSLYRAGRQSEALRSYQDMRTLLVDELGVDPTPQLQTLETLILDQDETLLLAPRRFIQRRAVLVADPGDPLELARLSPQDREATLTTVTSVLRAATEDFEPSGSYPAGAATYLVFDRVSDAAAAALAVAEHRHGQALRLAIDWGDVEGSEEGVSGPPVSRAATLVSLAHQGQVILSPEAQAEIVSSGDSVGLRFESLGSHSVRGVEEPLALYQLLAGDPPLSFPGLDPDRLPPPLPDSGQRSVPGFELREVIGTGSVGTLYRAYQPSVGREVLVEVIGRAQSSDAEFIRRFEADAQRLSLLEHPHISAVIDYWRDTEGAYLVYRMHRGGQLESGAAATTQLLRQMASALAYAHSYGVAHGSFRPDRIMLDESGNGYLLGFSIGGALPGPTVGDARYAAPEAASSPGATVAGDIYSLAVLAGEVESASPAATPSGSSRGPALARATATDPSDRPSNVAEFMTLMGHESSDGPAERFTSTRNPYKGLAAFTERDVEDFYGRSALTAELLESMAGSHFLAVVGPSGIGKSSVVRAGLIPAVRGGALGGSDGWVTTDMLPGSHPFLELRRAIERVAVELPPDVADRLAMRASNGLEHVSRALPAGTELLIVIDQFEELFTMTEPAEAEAFLDLLVSAAQDRVARIVVTLRADFLDRPLLHARFGEMLGDNLVTVAAPTAEELVEAISGPARGVGVSVDPRLVERMVAECADRPGALPLLQHTLAELFEARSTDELSLTSYEELGGVAGSLAARAENVFATAGPENAEGLRQAFLRMLTLGEEGAVTRRRVKLSDLADLGVDDAIDAFGQARLLVYDVDPESRTPSVEVAHEALLGNWPRLVSWIDVGREDLTLASRLAEAMADWEANSRRDEYLLTGDRLAQHTTWTETSSLALRPEPADFLQRSQAHDVKQRTRVRRVRVAVMATLAVVALAALGFAVSAVRSAGRADDRAREARAEALASASESVLQRDPELALMLAIEALETNSDSAAASRAANIALQQHRAIYQVPVADDAENDIFSASISPAGDLVAVTDWNTVAVWEVGNTDQPLWRWDVEGEGVPHVEFSADGDHLVATLILSNQEFCEDDTWLVLSARTGNEVMRRSVPGMQSYWNGVSQPGSYVDLTQPVVVADNTNQDGCFSDDAETELMALDIMTGQLRRVGVGTKPVARGSGVPTLSRTQSVLATADAVGGSVVDVASGEVLLSLPGGISALSPDGKLVLAGNEPLELWDVESGQRLRDFQGDFTNAWFSESGALVYGGSRSGSLLVFDTTSGQVVFDLSSSAPEVIRAQMTPDESRVVSLSADGDVRVWDIATPIRPTAGPDGFNADHADDGAVFFLRNSHMTSHGILAARALTAFGNSEREFGLQVVTPETTLYDTDTAETIVTYPGLVVAVSPDEQRVAYQATGPVVDRTEDPDEDDPAEIRLYTPFGAFYIADLRTGEPLVELQGWCEWLMPGLVANYDPIPGENCRDYPGPWFDFTQTGVFSPDGSMFATAGQSGHAAVWDTGSGEMLFSSQGEFPEFEGQQFISSQVAFSPDGRFFVRSYRRDFQVFEIDDWSLVAEYENDIAISHMEFTPDGKKLVLGDWFNVVTVIDTDGWTEQLRLEGQQGFLFPDIAIDPTGRFVATAGLDNDSRIWDLATGELVERLVIPPLTVGLRNVEWVDDATLYLSTRPRGFMMTLDPEVLIETARSTVTRTYTDEECATYKIDPCPALDEIRGE